MADNWQLKAVLSAVDNLSPVLKGVGNVAKATRKYLSDIVSSANALTSKIGMPLSILSGIIGGFSITAIKNAVVGFTDMGEAVYKGALRAGMSVEEYQRMKYVAEQAGVGVEMLEGAMGKLNAQTAKAAAGDNKKLAGLYDHLKIKIRDGNGQVRSAIDLLPQLADAFQRNKNPAVQARMGVALFGKSWAELAPLLTEGSSGLNESLERFKRLKGVMSLDDIKGAKDLGDKFKDLNFVTKGFQNTIAKELVPVLSPLIEDIIQWAAANRKVVSAGVKEFVKDLVAGLKSVDWQGIIQGAKNFADGLGWVTDMVGGTKNALILLAVVMNAQTIMALAGLVGALGRAGLAFLAMAAKAYLAGNTSLLSLLRVAAVALFTAGPIGALGAAFTWLGGIAAGAGGLISGAMGAVTLAIRGIGAAMMANPLGVILGLATAAYLIYKNWDALKSWFSSFFDWVGDKFKSLVGWALDLAHSVGGFFGGDASTRAATSSGSSLGSGDRPSLVAPQQSSAAFKVSFENAPPGTRVEQTQASGNVDTKTDVGYRSYATGMP